MSPLDTSFLHIEDGDRAVSLHIGSIGIFEGPPPPHETLARRLEQRLASVPRCRQRVEFVPFGLERPVWVDDADFSVDYHLRRTALPAPAGRDELRRLVGRLMSQRLDRTKPLWEMWVVEGLPDEQWVLVSKVHHCMVDGVSGAEVLAALLDVTRTPEDESVEPWVPEPAPSRRDLVMDAARDLTFDSYERIRLISAQVRRPTRALQQARELLPGLRSLGVVTRSVHTAGLTGPISPHREYTWADASLDEVKRVRRHLGGTVNDVVLAAVAGGFRQLLLSRGEKVRVDRVVRTLVPVSVRTQRHDGAAAHDGSFDNKVSAMFAELPVGIADPAERLSLITAQLADLKESGQAVAGEALTALSGFAPPALLGLGMRVAARAVRGTTTVHTVTTNVPGPQLPLYSCGRRLLRAYPYVPIAAPMRVGVAIFSYDGMVTFGVTGDREVSRDIDVLAQGIEAALAELLASADEAALPAAEVAGADGADPPTETPVAAAAGPPTETPVAEAAGLPAETPVAVEAEVAPPAADGPPAAAPTAADTDVASPTEDAPEPAAADSPAPAPADDPPSSTSHGPTPVAEVVVAADAPPAPAPRTRSRAPRKAATATKASPTPRARSPRAGKTTSPTKATAAPTKAASPTKAAAPAKKAATARPAPAKATATPAAKAAPVKRPASRSATAATSSEPINTGASKDPKAVNRSRGSGKSKGSKSSAKGKGQAKGNSKASKPPKPGKP